MGVFRKNLLLIAVFFLIGIQHASAVPDFYAFLSVPENASQELINQKISERMRSADPQMRRWLTQINNTIGNPNSRAVYDRNRLNLPTREREEHLRRILEETYSLRSGVNIKGALLNMLRAEQETRQWETMPGQQRFAEGERAIQLSLESERHYIARHLFNDRLSDFIVGNPSYEEIQEVGDLLRGGGRHRGRRAFDEWGQAYNHLLNVIRDNPSSTQEQFEAAFHQWVDTSEYEPNYREIRHPEARIWFEKYEQRFHRPSIELARSDLRRTAEFSEITSRFLFYSEGPAKQVYLLFKDHVLQHARRYGTNSFYGDPYFAPKHRAVLERLFLVAPTLRDEVTRGGGLFTRMASVVSNRAFCQLFLSRLAGSDH